MELGIKGRVAVITGSSKGIGKAIANGLAAEGVNVVLLARGKEQLNQAADEIQNQYKVRVLAIPTDITSTPSLKNAADTTAKEFGVVHIIVNNAGGPIRRMDRQINWPDTDWMDDVNVKTMGMLRTIQAFLPYIDKNGAGRIVNISGASASMVWNPALTHGINNSAMVHAMGISRRILQRTASPSTSWCRGWWARKPARFGRKIWGNNRARPRRNFSRNIARGWASFRGAGRLWKKLPMWLYSLLLTAPGTSRAPVYRSTVGLA